MEAEGEAEPQVVEAREEEAPTLHHLLLLQAILKRLTQILTLSRGLRLLHVKVGKEVARREVRL